MPRLCESLFYLGFPTFCLQIQLSCSPSGGIITICLKPRHIYIYIYKYVYIVVEELLNLMSSKDFFKTQVFFQQKVSIPEILDINGHLDIWVLPKIGVGPQIIHFNRVFHYKPSILGYPYFWKHPFAPIFFSFQARPKT